MQVMNRFAGCCSKITKHDHGNRTHDGVKVYYKSLTSCSTLKKHSHTYFFCTVGFTIASPQKVAMSVGLVMSACLLPY